MLTSLPFGASPQDTAEFMLGEVAVNVVLLESDGSIDASTEDWTPELIAGVKENIEEGLQWWIDTLALYSDRHQLNFVVDYTRADAPFETGYEPISRGSQDFSLWIDEFFRSENIPPSAGFTDEIRAFNHQQRVAHDTNWSFTIFVVNSENDPNGRFGDANANGTVFQRAFAFAGGQFIVMPHDRPAATVAHEVAHMFWAFDEYSAGDPYTARRGYYGVQNTNGANGHPNPHEREPSIMASTSSPFSRYEVSQSAREILGWRDSDGDGIFDVLDVPHQLTGTAEFQDDSRTVRFVGSSSVQTLDNQNTRGTRNDMTLNRITDLQYRVDGGPWTNLSSFDAYTVEIDATTPVLPLDANLVEFRTVDARIGVESNIVQTGVNGETPATMQNPTNALDVSGDGHITALDALQVIIAINSGAEPNSSGPPYLDVTGDGMVTARDVLLVINFINTNPPQLSAITPVDGQGEPHSCPLSNPTDCDAVAAVFSAPLDQDDEDESWIDMLPTA